MDSSQGEQVELPDAKAIFPYLGLFTLVTLKPTGSRILTTRLPSLSIMRGTKFVKAPSNTSATAKTAARIFEPLALDDNAPLSLGVIPLSPQDQAFTEKRYWRFPVPTAAIFGALIERLTYDSSSSECEDIVLAKNIRAILDLQSRNAYRPDRFAGGSGLSGDDGPSGGGGPEGGGSSGGGPSAGDRRRSKRKGTSGKSSSPSGKDKKKARKVSGGNDGTGDCSEASGELIRTFRLPLQTIP